MNVNSTIRLLFWPIIWMASIQLGFAFIGFIVFRDKTVSQFVYASFISAAIAFALHFRYRKAPLSKVFFREALAFATVTWIVVGILGALPILFITEVTFTDAVFESISALTTTGATILTGLVRILVYLNRYSGEYEHPDGSHAGLGSFLA